MDEISQGPQRDGRPPRTPRWLTAAAIAGVVAVAAVVMVTRGGGGPRGGSSGGSGSGGNGAAAPAASRATTVTTGELGVRMVVPQVLQPTSTGGPRPRTVPGTLLLTCDAVLWGQLPPDWRAGSLRVGPLWLVGGRKLGYAHFGRVAPAGRTRPIRATASRVVEMLVHVDAGATVAIRTAAGAPPDFRFTEAGLDRADMSRAADRGFTLASCPRGARGSGVWTDFYDLGFTVVPGHAVTVEVWTSPSARPVWISFTAPGGMWVGKPRGMWWGAGGISRG